MSRNLVLLLGRVGKDPEVKHLESGSVVANFSMATSEKYTNKEGDKVENTEWHNIVAWGKLAEVIEKYVKKGDLLDVSGKIVTRSWDDNDGNKRYITEININRLDMLGTKNNESGEAKQEKQAEQNTAPVYDDGDPGPGEDEIPF